MKQIYNISELKIGDWLLSGTVITKIIRYDESIDRFIEKFDNGTVAYACLVTGADSFILTEEEVTEYLLNESLE